MGMVSSIMIALDETAGQMSSVDVMRELKAQAREHMITELLPSDFFSTNRKRAVTRSTVDVKKGKVAETCSNTKTNLGLGPISNSCLSRKYCLTHQK